MSHFTTIPRGTPALSGGRPSVLSQDLQPYGPKHQFNVSSQALETQCATLACSKKDGLTRCSACKVVMYCGRDHQIEDRAAHKSLCNKIKKAQVETVRKENELRAEDEDIFKDGKGHFWGIHETRGYMSARFALVEAQLKINTPQAVKASLDHLLDMLQLCRGDNMGVRDLIPALYLRLGRDQECYDFCKWWATTGAESNYDWGDMNNGYLDVKNADVFESAVIFTRKRAALSPSVAITLIKIRLLIDLQTLQRAKDEIGPHVPQEILDRVQAQSVSPIITNSPKILERDQTPHIKELKGQIKELYDAITESNKHFWPALIKPGNNLNARPQMYGFGDPTQMQLILQYSYNSWAETAGAIGVIEELLC